jgi:hypothetical protein
MCGVVLMEKSTTQKSTSIFPLSTDNPAVQLAKEKFTEELNKKLKLHDAGLKAGKELTN